VNSISNLKLAVVLLVVLLVERDVTVSNEIE